MILLAGALQQIKVKLGNSTVLDFGGQTHQFFPPGHHKATHTQQGATRTTVDTTQQLNNNIRLSTKCRQRSLAWWA